MKKVAVLQSNYIPWKGYFDMIHDVDLFIFYDDRQYTKNDWRNRNKIKTPQGAQWLTIPVGDHDNLLIDQIKLQSPDWAAKHWRSLVQYYSKAPYFKTYESALKKIYETKWEYLSELNQHLIMFIAKELLGIQTAFDRSENYALTGDKFDRLVQLLKKCGAEYYLSGPSAKDYMDEAAMAAVGIQLVYKDYSGYPEYPQFFPPFAHNVSILDLLFQKGPEAPFYIWGWRQAKL